MAALALRRWPTLRSMAWLVLLVCLALPLSSASALSVPPLTARVNDTAHLLSPATIRLLNQSLEALNNRESTQIVVLTIPSLEGEVLESYSLKVAETWKIGQKGLDNGALLLVAVQERKVRIETGYGLEGRLTDLVAGRIIREQIVPAFRRGNFDQGVIDGVTAMIAAVQGEYANQGNRPENRPSGDHGPFLMLLVFGLLMIGRIFHRVKPVAAGLGGLYAPVLAASLFSGLFSGLILALLIPVGLLGALLASSLNSSGGRGIFLGGPGLGGGMSGGGFSGGGGGFGGGGASGGW